MKNGQHARSKAKGGPLDGVTLVASPSWLGVVRTDPSGRYRWDRLEETWIWHAYPEESIKPKRGARLK